MDLQSLLGYSQNSPYAGNPYLDIHTPEGYIDMSNTPIDLLGIDNKGNKKKMKAGRKNPYRFEGNIVREIPMQQGGRKPIIVSSPNDPRLKAYNDSLISYNNGKLITDELLKKKLGTTTRSALLAEYDKVLNKYPVNENLVINDITTPIVGSYRDSRGLVNSYAPAFKKPVQPVVYQKPQQAPIKSQMMPTGTKAPKVIPKDWVNWTDPKNKIEFMDPRYEYAAEGYLKPIKPKAPIEQKDYPIRGPLPKAQVRGTISGGEQGVIPQPEGDYIYGPANSVIGINSKNGFVPWNGVNQQAKVNQPDKDLMANPEELRKYLISKGIQNNPYQKGGFSKESIFNFLFDDKEDTTEEVTKKVENTAPSAEDISPEDTGQDDLAMEQANMSWDNPADSGFGNPYNGTSNSLSGYGSQFQSIDTRVASATQELLQKFPNLRLTSGRRTWGDKDAHPKGRAVDISYDPQAYEYYKNTIVPKYGFNPALKPNHGTGPHIHLGYY